MKGLPVQQDSFNYAIYTKWYLFMECYKGKEMVDLDSETFREQLLFYIVCLYIYCQYVEKKSYNFPKTFEWSDLLKTGIDETIKDIMELQQDFRVMQLSSLFFQQQCVGFHESYSMVNNYFYNLNLSLTISDNLSGVLNTLADVPNADVKVQLRWNLMNKQKKGWVQKATQEIFTDDGDHTFFDNLLKKKSTIVISIKIFNKITNDEFYYICINHQDQPKQRCFTCCCRLHWINRSSTKRYNSIVHL